VKGWVISLIVGNPGCKQNDAPATPDAARLGFAQVPHFVSRSLVAGLVAGFSYPRGHLHDG